MTEKEFKEIVKEAMGGDHDAFMKLCEEKGKDILYISMHLMGNVQDGEDAAQEIMIRMQKKLGDLKHPDAFHVWLYRIIKSVCLNMRRKNKKMMLPFSQTQLETNERRKEFLPYEFAEDDARKELLLKIINELPFKCKMCMLMFYYQEMSYEDIGKALRMSKKDVDNTLIKAKKLIRRKLKKEPLAKEFLGKIHTLAPVPILTQILKEDAGRRIAGSTINRMVVKVGTVSLKPKLRNPFGQTAAKVSVGMTVTAGAAVIGINSYMKNELPEVLPEPAPIAAESVEEPVEEPEVFIPEEPEQVIETLEDMIGDTEAEYLRTLSGGEESERDAALAFLDEIGMESGQSLWEEEILERDTVYTLEKQDKRLIVVTKDNQTDGTYQLVYRFTHIDEPVPKNEELLFCFEQWES